MSIVKIAVAKWRLIAKKIVAHGGATTDAEKGLVNAITNRNLDNLSYGQVRFFNKAEKAGLYNNNYAINISDMNPAHPGSSGGWGKLKSKLSKINPISREAVR